MGDRPSIRLVLSREPSGHDIRAINAWLWTHVGLNVEARRCDNPMAVEIIEDNDDILEIVRAVELVSAMPAKEVRGG